VALLFLAKRHPALPAFVARDQAIKQRPRHHGRGSFFTLRACDSTSRNAAQKPPGSFFHSEKFCFIS
jgi:hypothetical protein